MTPAVALVHPSHVYIKPSIYTRGTGKAKKHIVKWKVAGAERSRSFDAAPAARGFKADLEAAANGRNRESFDRVSGLPESMLVGAAGATFLDYVRRLVETEWAEWSPGNRRARVEGFAELAAVFVTSGRGRPERELLRRWVRDIALERDAARRDRLSADGLRLGNKQVTPAELAAAGTWLEKHSRPVTDLAGLLVVEELLTETTVSPYGVHYAPDTRQRIRTALSLVCTEAVRHGEVPANLVGTAKVKVKEESKEVDPDTIPSVFQARLMVDALATISAQAVRQYRAYFTLLWTTGMRPSEATGLRNSADLVLPESGWGKAVLKRPTVHTGARWTDSGDAHDDRKQLKARKRKGTRVVLLPPEAVAELRRHIEDNKVGRGERVFTNSNGKPIDPSAMSGVWRKCRSRAFPDGDFDHCRPYDLRHVAASTALQAEGPNGERISVPRVAQQLGNSPATLMRVYARVISTDDSDFMAAMDAELTGA